MGNSNGVISAPVNTDDVSTVLGIASHDIAFLCSDSMGATKKINMWAKYKPEAIGGPSSLTLNQRMDNNFGLEPTAVYMGKSALITAVNNGSFNGGWSYKRISPYVYNTDGTIKSGRGDWARLDDFVGYNHKATIPFGSISPGKFTLTANTNNKTVINLDAPDNGDGTDIGMLSIKDFRNSNLPLKDWYFGVLLINSARSFIATTVNPIGTNEDWQVDFGWINPSYSGTYKGVPFLSSKPYTVNGAEQGGVRLVGIGTPGVEIQLVRITAEYQFVLSCVFTSVSSNTVEYDLKIVNTTSQAKSWSDIRIYAGTSSSGSNAVQIANLGTISVPAQGTVNKRGSVALSAPSGWASDYYTWCRVSFTGASAADQTWVQMDQPADLPDA